MVLIVIVVKVTITVSPIHYPFPSLPSVETSLPKHAFTSGPSRVKQRGRETIIVKIVPMSDATVPAFMVTRVALILQFKTSRQTQAPLRHRITHATRLRTVVKFTRMALPPSSPVDPVIALIIHFTVNPDRKAKGVDITHMGLNRLHSTVFTFEVSLFIGLLNSKFVNKYTEPFRRISATSMLPGTPTRRQPFIQ